MTACPFRRQLQDAARPCHGQARGLAAQIGADLVAFDRRGPFVDGVAGLCMRPAPRPYAASVRTGIHRKPPCGMSLPRRSYRPSNRQGLACVPIRAVHRFRRARSFGNEMARTRTRLPHMRASQGGGRIQGSVEVGLQPDPVDYHAIYVVFVDILGTAGSTRGTDGRVRSRLRSGLCVGSRPRSRPHDPSPPPRYALVRRPRFILQNKHDKVSGAGVLGGSARAPYPRPGEVRGTDEVTSQRYLALATLKGPQNLPQYDPDLAAILPQQNQAPFCAARVAGRR